MSCAYTLFLIGAIALVSGLLTAKRGRTTRGAVGVALGLAVVFVGLLSLWGAKDVERRRLEDRAEEERLEALRLSETRENADAIFAEGVRLAREGKFKRAATQFDRLAEAKPEHPGLEKARAENQAALAAEQKQLRDAAERTLRQAKQATMREAFLDAGLDIKVSVSGKRSDRIRLTYALFNDVWSHRLKKEGLVDQLCRDGFKTIEMRDGYNWGMHWTCNP